MAELTDKQNEFVRAYVSGGSDVAGNATKSAIAAGFSEKTARVQGQQLLAKKHVQVSIIDETRLRLGRLAPLAASVMENILVDEAAPPKTRLDAAKALFDRIGVGPITTNLERHEAEVSRMSLVELAISVQERMGPKEITSKVELTGDNQADIARAILAKQ